MNKALLSTLLVATLAVSAPSMAQETKNPPAQDAVITSISINNASADQLAMLTGIGSAKAKAIVEYREANGAFDSIDDLAKVSGIGPATVEKNRHLLTE
ncbi:competence protein ComEA [Oceanisphaera marina]|uniref:Competence protein ComEA n=1 Tax=Oceanisphaera marina TaxID=2017550 RepID=A0ABQ1ILQ2_9GAMM|nr:helix-hairpin-helix domain-containing protein [Oceanisphaera marina]GGB44884.1 competence protein ComEA [Oceanisphaera marina]